MKNYVYERKLDELGRIVLPIELRRILSLSEKDIVLLELNEENLTVKLKKSLPSCLNCSNTKQADLKDLSNNRYICIHCLDKLR